jgi:hypothetical protein
MERRLRERESERERGLRAEPTVLQFQLLCIRLLQGTLEIRHLRKEILVVNLEMKGKGGVQDLGGWMFG